ncbi:CHASE domain-containing protein [Erythrobacter litoralis]|uniref:CHASE domain-containing protein n=1 Tax=Erythrobacter litoralis TaxID=39960 RepID=UPI002435DE8A|nr:CHASE domain-containing protein [Erythrobacter litoralis]
MLSVFAIERGERVRERAEIIRDTQAIATAIERRIYSHSSYLRAGAALFSAQDSVDPATFRRFVTELRLDTDYRGAEGLGYAPVIDASEVVAYEQRLNMGRNTTRSVWPSLAQQPRDKLVPVLFLRPDTQRNRRALGFDMYSDPVRREAMDEAERDGRPTATGEIVLKQEGTGDAAGFNIYMPIFNNSAVGRELKGFIYSPFNAAQFLASTSESSLGDDMAVQLSDLATGDLMARRGEWREEGTSISRQIDLANHPVRLTVQSAVDTTLSPLSLITLLSGLAVASLLTIVARLLTKQAAEDHRSLQWFAEQNSIRNSLTRELNHRVKNTLANVLSIVSMTRRRATSLDEFAEGIDARIRALSATHDLLTQSDWGTTPVRAVVEAELSPYARDEDQQIVLDGPEVELAPNDALSLGLAVHELATNATKYGSLSVPGGRVEVQWDLVTPALAQIDWRESGGPDVTPPNKRGFGTDLIEKIVAHELRQPVELEFDPAGVRCSLRIPVRETGDFELRKKKL